MSDLRLFANRSQEEIDAIFDTYAERDFEDLPADMFFSLLIEAGDDFAINVPDKYVWMTLNQIKTFIKFNNYLNIQSRSLLSVIKFV